MALDAGFDQQGGSLEKESQVGYKIAATSLASEAHPNRNEDSHFYSQRREVAIAGVFDGMGGLANGAEASMLARNIILKKMQEMPQSASHESMRGIVNEALHSANLELQKLAKDKGDLGTTATVAVVCDIPNSLEKYAVIGNVGDSRAYLFRNGRLEYITLDDSSIRQTSSEDESRFLQDKLSRVVSDNALTEREKHFYNTRNQIGQSLGSPHDIRPNIYTLTLQPNDRLLLTSDGITDNLTTDEIEALLAVNANPHHATFKLASSALERSRIGNMRSKADDMTALVIDIPKPEARVESRDIKSEAQPLEAKPARVFRIGSKVNVMRTSGVINGGWVVQGDPDEGGFVKVIKDENGQRLLKEVPVASLELLNKPITQADILNAKSFDELQDTLIGLGGLQGSNGFIASDELIKILDLLRSGNAQIENVTRAGGLRTKVQELLELDKLRKQFGK